MTEPPSGISVGAELDGLSLNQALIDFELANARVLDLTQRLVECQIRIAELNTELEVLRIEHAQSKATHEQMKSSRAFKSAAKIWAIRNAIGR